MAISCSHCFRHTLISGGSPFCVCKLSSSRHVHVVLLFYLYLLCMRALISVACVSDFNFFVYKDSFSPCACTCVRVIHVPKLSWSLTTVKGREDKKKIKIGPTILLKKIGFELKTNLTRTAICTHPLSFSSV